MNRKVCLFASAAALLAGCVGDATLEGDGTPHDEKSSEAHLGGRMGVDYSFGRPSPGSIRADGYTFAARYVSDEPSKNITFDEAQALISAGVDVVVVWEDDGYSEILDGYARGVQNAQRAEAQAQAAGMPGGRPIYFAIDFDAQPYQQGSVDAFMDGAASVLGRGRVGAYGGLGVIQRLFDGGKISFGWQTYAWSYGNWDPRAQVRQVNNGAACSGSCDVDEAIASDFGQWGAASGSDGCTDQQRGACATYGSACVDNQCNGGTSPGTGCTSGELQACGTYGSNCVDHQCNGGTAPGTGCTWRESHDCGTYGSDCVDHQCNGGTAPGTGCTWRETHDCGAYGSDCVDHQCNGGTAPGTGCTWRESHDCGAYGSDCVDHQCNGGTAPGTGCTWRESHDCGAYGSDCVDHQCNGGTAPGSGCTWRETHDCTAAGAGCADHKCSGGTAPGTGCTWRQTHDCTAAGKSCSMGACQ